MKNKDIVNLSAAELTEKIKEGKEALGKLKLNQSITPIDSPAKIRTDRRAIAKMLTQLTKVTNATKK